VDATYSQSSYPTLRVISQDAIA